MRRRRVCRSSCTGRVTGTALRCCLAATVRWNLAPFGFRAAFDGVEIGLASATKIMRGIKMKDIAALYLECKRIAEQVGTDTSIAGRIRAKCRNRLLPRTEIHAARHADQIRQVSEIFYEIDVKPFMALAIERGLRRHASLEPEEG